VADAAILLGVLAAIDPDDRVTAESGGRSVKDYTQFLNAAGLKDARIGVARNLYNAGPAVDRLLKNAIEAMKHAGAEIVDPANLQTA
jgi:amidase